MWLGLRYVLLCHSCFDLWYVSCKFLANPFLATRLNIMAGRRTVSYHLTNEYSVIRRTSNFHDPKIGTSQFHQYPGGLLQSRAPQMANSAPLEVLDQTFC